MKTIKKLFSVLVLACLAGGAHAELNDQGLKSIMDIIDKAIESLNQQADATGDDADPAQREADLQNASSTVVNLSRTLGTLSYSRLQCGQAEVLSEFTQRVQLMPEDSRDPMRDAFQEGFDKSKEETPLLSEDECERLTRSRARSETVDEANVKQEKAPAAKPQPEQAKVEEAPAEEEDPKLRHMRVAEMSGQLAYKRRFCENEKVFNRDYNEYLESVPQDYRAAAKDAYWKGYQRGKRLNKHLTRAQCPA